MAPRLGDPLKLGTPGRIRLDPGETVLGSGKLEAGAGTVRWVLTDNAGHVTARLGVGGEWWGSRHDDAGPWNADMDTSAAVNAEYAKLNAEQGAAENRLFEIDAAAQYAAVGKTYAQLAAERDAARARMDEIHAFDRRHTAACQWYEFGNDYNGTGVAPPEEDRYLTGYCEPGEFDRLKTQLNALNGLPDPGQYADDIPGWPRPGEPGERERLEARVDELDGMGNDEVYPTGYTTRLDMAGLDKLRDDTAPAIALARQHGAALVAYYDERERLEAACDQYLGRDEPLTDAEAAQLDADHAALEAHKATPEPTPPAGIVDDYTYAAGVVRGAWGDLHWAVEFDETADLRLGVIPHGQTDIAGLSDLSDQESACRLSLGLPLCGYDDPDEVATLVKQLDRVSATGHAAQAPAGGGSGSGAGRGSHRARPALGPRWQNVIEAWSEATGQSFPPDGAIEEIDAYFLAFAGACRQIGDATSERAAALYGETPLVGRLLDHLDQAGAAWAAIGDRGDELYAAWTVEHAADLKRQREPRPHESMLDVV